MRILVSGSTGLVGAALVPFLTAKGHTVIRLVRSRARLAEGDILWEPEAAKVDTAGLEGLGAVVHLAGESIVGRWTAAKKARIRDSRVKGTQFLCHSLARLEQLPRVLVCASAVGYYGNRGDEVLDELSAAGTGFLAGVCGEWEAACGPAVEKGIRVVNLRNGVVLSAGGGALKRMLPLFRLGLGGRLGSGKQYMAWIAIDDLVGVILHALTRECLGGPVNAVAPNPVTNLEFTRTLGRVLGRPTALPVPAFALSLAFGEMADESLLASTRAVPAQLLATGYVFRYPDLEGALRHLLGR